MTGAYLASAEPCRGAPQLRSRPSEAESSATVAGFGSRPEPVFAADRPAGCATVMRNACDRDQADSRVAPCSARPPGVSSPQY